ncbi:hypothetical protein [Deinococcus petrolearius]|uniref:TIGR02588 family protein n=1 Tax=Deinococcus petrolearius TaxID=1751295 RepID=A0ABW1DIR5_9DEIO
MTQDDQPAHQKPQDQEGTPSQRRPPSALEWAASAVALLLVTGTLGYLVWHASQPARPVAFELRPGALERRLDRYHQEVEVRNLGSGSTGQVQLRGTLRRAGEVVEEVSGQLDGLPADSARRTTLIFRENPEGGTLNLDVESYGEP